MQYDDTKLNCICTQFPFASLPFLIFVRPVDWNGRKIEFREIKTIFKEIKVLKDLKIV
jgi:hypothetical protein